MQCTVAVLLVKKMLWARCCTLIACHLTSGVVENKWGNVIPPNIRTRGNGDTLAFPQICKEK